MVSIMKQNFSTERISEDYILLNSCGIQSFYDTNAECNRENGRIDYHILYIADGICHLEKNNEYIEVPQGNIILFNPGDKQHYAFRMEDKSTSYYIHFTGVGCKDLLGGIPFDKNNILNIGKNIQFEEIFKKMLKEYSLKQYSYESYCSGLLMELFAIINRCSWLNKNKIGNKNEKIITNACQTIYKKITTVTVGELANQSYLSVGRFSHIFKEVTGKSPLEYINIMRIQMAKDMLTNTDFPISKIANNVGFDDQNYFSRLFKKYTKISPSQYRNN